MQPFGGPEQVLEYLSRYIHRVAISNHRLIKVEGGRVYFKWKNYRKGGKLQNASLEVFEFIRRLSSILQSIGNEPERTTWILSCTYIFFWSRLGWFIGAIILGYSLTSYVYRGGKVIRVKR